MPTGRGKPNQTGLDFYDRLVDALLAVNVEPFVTLNHWDMPQVLQDRGGWPARDACGAFCEYAAAVSRRLGDRVRHWATHNEPWCIATLGYEEGVHAPGHRDPGEALRASHHLLLSHGQATHILRSLVPKAEVGIVLNISPGRPATETDADRDAVRQFDGFFHRWYLDPLFRGRYPDDAVGDRIRWGHLSSDALPFVHDGDMDHICVPLDYVGVNYYSGNLIEAGTEGRPRAVAAAPREELTEMGWAIDPDGLVDALDRLDRDYGSPPLYITENGAAFADPPPGQSPLAKPTKDPDGSLCGTPRSSPCSHLDQSPNRISDPKRVAYVRDHLIVAHRAIDRGIKLRGYFVWSLMDNFEWNNGFTKRFGLFGVDFATGERTPKESAYWYRNTVARGAVGNGAVDNGAVDDGVTRPTNQG